MLAVEKHSKTVPVKVGIGTEKQTAALLSAGCDKVFSVAEIKAYKAGSPGIPPLTMDVIFRPEDTVIMVQPGYLPLPLMREIASTGCQFQVPGHAAMRFQSDDDRAEWRRQKPRGANVAQAPEATGRPPKWPVPTPEQGAAFLADWNSDMKRGLVVERMQGRVGAKVPAHWCRDLAIKLQGTAKRNKD